MRTYSPRIKVTLIKNIRRRQLVEGLPTVLDRSGNLTRIDLTPWLGESGEVRTSKSVRQPYGQFSVSFGDKAHPQLAETVYALVEPMDLVEIRVARSLRDYPGGLPILMRGLVSAVTRGETMAGDQPVRTVTLAGQDFGKILSLIEIFYPNNQSLGDNYLHAFAYFQKYATANAARLKSAAEFTTDVVADIVNPYLRLFAALADRTGGQVLDAFRVEASLAGYVSPYTLLSFVNVSLDQMLRAVLDVGPFNEMYIEDREDQLALVARPVPFVSAVGDYIQDGAKALTVTVDSVDLQSLSVTRSDLGVANYYWVGNDRWQFLQNVDLRLLAQQGPPESFILFDYENSADKHYGIRKMEVESTLGPPNYLNSQAQSKDDLPSQTNALADWLVQRRKTLADLNKDNVLFEQGEARLKGNERIKPGMYVRFRRGGRLDYAGEAYAHTVEQQFLPYRGFFTSIQFDRGTGFIERSRQPVAPYRRELDARGTP